ncbi:unnamed protein product [Penicillium salamii]|uniref:NADH:flavin oxidoreductase/NADH oxidase N-terminal domain-containing protein n=1 Tax=Penicillium salamii TaxID=1612424 RepID=A0A9W4NRF5_9EURO|nr:unnamed protein product [Penicillium salamii]CAG8104608.1 unnamed protein product [Penicillium salamii]CAG8138760.1 unnamed protein product [Penicillium salamii]CAG8143673.1 unnamed protein product [Penicillium salamii]CAG8178910.1 unnamed protein product [Penicillium salamii]
MPRDDIFEPVPSTYGPPLQSRLIMAPLIYLKNNICSELSPHDENVIRRCNAAGIALLMACLLPVDFQDGMKGGEPTFPNLQATAKFINKNGGQSIVQLHQKTLHSCTKSGIRSSVSYYGLAINENQICSTEIRALRDRFLELARHAHAADFQGVEVNATSDSVFAQFLSPIVNKRADRYGGSLRNRSRLLFEIITDLRSAFPSQFRVALRLSTDWRGSSPHEVREITTWIMQDEAVDYLEIAFGSADITSESSVLQNHTSLCAIEDINLCSVPLGCSGQISSVKHVVSLLDSGWDFVMLGESRKS